MIFDQLSYKQPYMHMAITLREAMVPLSVAIAILLSSFDHPFLKTAGVTQDYVVTKLGFVVETMTIMVLGASPAFVRGVSVSNIVTQDHSSRESCPWMNFYTRDAFLSAVGSYPHFGNTGSSDDSKREIAAFFANLAHQTRRFCSTEENNGAATNEYPCVDGDKHYLIGFNGFSKPKISANDAVASFKSALWFWMNNAHSVTNQGFGATIRAINGALECNGQNPDEADARIQLYQKYCCDLGVDPGQNVSC